MCGVASLLAFEAQCLVIPIDSTDWKAYLKSMQTLQHSACEKVLSSTLCNRSDKSETRTHPHRDISDESVEIAERLKAHDPRILDELILRYQRRLLGYLMRLTADRELSEDLLQETWLRVWTRGSQFNGDSRVATWLFDIARNLVFDRRRHHVWSFSLESMTAEENGRPLVACRREIVSRNAACWIRILPLERASIGGIGIDITA